MTLGNGLEFAPWCSSAVGVRRSVRLFGIGFLMCLDVDIDACFVLRGGGSKKEEVLKPFEVSRFLFWHGWRMFRDDKLLNLFTNYYTCTLPMPSTRIIKWFQQKNRQYPQNQLYLLIAL